MYIVDLLGKEYRRSKVEIKNESFYTVSIPVSIVKEVGFYICGMKLKNLSKMIHKIFLNDLYGYIEVSVGNELKFYNAQHKSLNKQNVMRAISQFLQFYDISEDEISIDSIYRNFYRDRKSDKSQKDKKELASHGL
jgi:pyrrolidone-carboxylate peptidase